MRSTAALLAAVVWCGALVAPAQSGSPHRVYMQISGCATKDGGPYGRPVWAQHPTRYGLTCNGIGQVVGVRWRHWGAATARASATLVLETCKPSCATGPTNRYRGTVVATNIKRCGTRRVYGSVAIHWTDAGRRRTSAGPLQGCLPRSTTAASGRVYFFRNVAATFRTSGPNYYAIYRP
jgi:hypothetical protein